MSFIRLPKGSVSPSSALKKDDQPPHSDVGGRQQSPEVFQKIRERKTRGCHSWLSTDRYVNSWPRFCLSGSSHRSFGIFNNLSLIVH